MWKFLKFSDGPRCLLISSELRFKTWIFKHFHVYFILEKEMRKRVADEDLKRLNLNKEKSLLLSH